METTMTEQLEVDLREAFSRCASSVPRDAGERLRSIDYRPRTGRVSPRLKVGSLAGAAVTTGTVISVVVLGGASPAFAGWSAAPTVASAAQTGTADGSCQAQLAQLASAPALAGPTEGSAWTPVATDVRGPFTLVVYQGGPTDATCLTGPSMTAVSVSTGNGATERISGSGSSTGAGTADGSSSVSVLRGSGSDDIEQMTTAHLDSAAAGPYTVVDGQADAAVTRVTLVRSDGEDVEASTGSGWFVAWWPGSLDAASAQVTTGNGVASEPINAPAPPSSGSGTCAGTAQADSQTCSGGGGGAPGTSTVAGSQGAPSSANGAG
jgi:hypothetical protein